MNKKDFAKLCFNFNKDPNEDLYELWKDNLRLYDDNEIQKAINTIISTDKFFPTLSRFLEVVKEIVKNEIIDFNSEKVVREKIKRLNIHLKWLDKEIINKPIDKEIEKEFENFNKFIEEFRNEK